MAYPVRLDEWIHIRGERKNALCVGLDPVMTRMPQGVEQTPAGVRDFLENIIKSTRDHCVAYKVNFAFFEALGREGWDILYQVRSLLPDTHFLIADAKRGDVGHTAQRYATSILGDLKFDAVTLNPYMGEDVYAPFLAYDDATLIVLALTSNPSHQDFQIQSLDSGRRIYQEVIRKAADVIPKDRLMFVVGGTHDDLLQEAMNTAHGHALLIPGYGAQGGQLPHILQSCDQHDCHGLINSSRGIIFASEGEDYAEAAGRKAAGIAEEMRSFFEGR